MTNSNPQSMRGMPPRGLKSKLQLAAKFGTPSSTATTQRTARQSPEAPTRKPAAAEAPPTDESAELIALLHACSPTYMKLRSAELRSADLRGGAGAPPLPSSTKSAPAAPIGPVAIHMPSVTPSTVAPPMELVAPPMEVVAPPMVVVPDAIRSVAAAAEAALEAAACPAKAAIFINDDEAPFDETPSQSSLLADPLALLIASQLACGPETRVRLSGKRRKHLSVSATDERALERALVAGAGH